LEDYYEYGLPLPAGMVDPTGGVVSDVGPSYGDVLFGKAEMATGPQVRSKELRRERERAQAMAHAARIDDLSWQIELVEARLAQLDAGLYETDMDREGAHPSLLRTWLTGPTPGEAQKRYMNLREQRRTAEMHMNALVREVQASASAFHEGEGGLMSFWGSNSETAFDGGIGLEGALRAVAAERTHVPGLGYSAGPEGFIGVGTLARLGFREISSHLAARAVAVSAPRTAFNRSGVIVEASEADYGRMLSIARRMASRLGIDPDEILRVRELGGPVGQTVGGSRFWLDPKAFRAGVDARLNRMVSPLENLKRTIIHEHAHVMQGAKRADAYWEAVEGNKALHDWLEAVAYRFEDFYYGVLNRRGK